MQKPALSIKRANVYTVPSAENYIKGDKKTAIKQMISSCFCWPLGVERRLSSFALFGPIYLELAILIDSGDDERQGRAPVGVKIK